MDVHPSSYRHDPGATVQIGANSSNSMFFNQAFFDRLLKSTGEKQKRNLSKPNFTGLHYVMMMAGFLLILASGFIVLGGGHAMVASKRAVGLINVGSSFSNSTASLENSDNPAPSTAPVSASALAVYTVAPSLPRYLIIPSLGVDARVLSVGVTTGGAIATPGDIYDTAWYNGSSEPGQPGAMLIDGHVSSWTAHGVFYSLNRLVPGDVIQVERGDGTTFTYKVVKTEVYPTGNVNMQAALSPVTAGQPGLNLITCTGQVIAGTSEFNERLVVFASEVSS